MKILALLNHGLLLLLSLSTGFLKVAGLFTNKVEFEFKLFYAMGFSHTMVVLFGVLQVVGGLMLLTEKTLKPGTILLAVTFAIATAALFVDKNIPFGAASLLFIAMAGFCMKRNKFSQA